MTELEQGTILARLLAEMNDLRGKVNQQAAEIANLKSGQPNNTTMPAIIEGQAVTSRRRILKKLALATAGAAAAGVALATTTSDAQAATVVGTNNISDGGGANFGISTAPTGVTNITPGGVKAFGVLARTDNSAVFSNTVDTAVGGSSTNGYGARLRGGLAALKLDKVDTTIGPPGASTDSHLEGEFYLDGNASLFYCIKSGTGLQSPTNPNGAAWVTLATDRTAGVRFFGSPIRVAIVSSATNGNNGPGRTLNLLTAQSGQPTSGTIVQVAGVTDLGGLNTTDIVPVGARAVIGVLTNISATAPGNLRLWPTDGIIPSVVNLNIPNVNGIFPNISVNFTGRLNISGTAGKDGTLSIAYSAANPPNNTCGFAIDITGYYVQ